MHLLILNQYKRQRILVNVKFKSIISGLKEVFANIVNGKPIIGLSIGNYNKGSIAIRAFELFVLGELIGSQFAIVFVFKSGTFKGGTTYVLQSNIDGSVL